MGKIAVFISVLLLAFGAILGLSSIQDRCEQGQVTFSVGTFSQVVDFNTSEVLKDAGVDQCVSSGVTNSLKWAGALILFVVGGRQFLNNVLFKKKG